MGHTYMYMYIAIFLSHCGCCVRVFMYIYMYVLYVFGVHVVSAPFFGLHLFLFLSSLVFLACSVLYTRLFMYSVFAKHRQPILVHMCLGFSNKWIEFDWRNIVVDSKTASIEIHVYVHLWKQVM